MCPYCNEPMSVTSEQETTTPSAEQVTENINKEETPVMSNLQKTVEKTKESVTEPEVSNTFFKNFWIDKSLTSCLLILIGIYFLIGLLMLSDNQSLAIIAQIGQAAVGVAMVLIIIQRVAEDRSKIDISSWLGIGSMIFWAIGMIIGENAINNPGLDIFDYAHISDTTADASTIRYFVCSGVVGFAVSSLLDLASKYFMYQTAKKQYKTTMIIGMVAAGIILLLSLTAKSLSQPLLLGFVVLSGLVSFIYYMMIIFTKDGREKKKEVVPSSDNPSNLTVILWIVGLVSFIIILVSMARCSDEKYDSQIKTPFIYEGYTMNELT